MTKAEESEFFDFGTSKVELVEDRMFNEIPAKKGKLKYDSDDWQEYAIHDDMGIRGFFGEYRWLSNFHPCVVFFEGLKYPSTENAYQAAKVDQDYRHYLQECSSGQSKKLWKEFPRIDISGKEWDARKYDIMAVIVFDKFTRHLDLRKQLIETGNKYLEELNHWNDIFWGVDIKKSGQNRLGKILMNTRQYFVNHSENIALPLPLEDRR